MNCIRAAAELHAEEHIDRIIAALLGGGSVKDSRPIRCRPVYTCLLALNDSGTPCFDEQLARKLAALAIPCFACTPQRLPELLEGALRGANLVALADRITQSAKSK